MTKDQKYYMEQCRKTLMKITKLKPEDGFVFLRLKKKAKKYLEKAQAFEKLKSENPVK